MAGALTLLAVGAWAHPHVFIQATLNFEFEGSSCVGFWEEWTFDAVFSAELAHNFDLDGNGAFSDAEQQKIHNGAFINLRKYGFYTLIRSGSTRKSPQAVESFSATLRDGRAVYRFYVPLDDALAAGDFSVAIFDTTYYSAIQYPESFAAGTQKRAGYSLPSFSRQVDKRYPVYYNPSGGAQDMTTYSKPGPGLQTAYPEEILVSFGG